MYDGCDVSFAYLWVLFFLVVPVVIGAWILIDMRRIERQWSDKDNQ